VLEDIEMARAAARGLVAESKIWEALDCLAKARALAEGTSEERSLRILTWETQAKLPSLMRQAHQNLEDLAREEPADVAVHSALGRLNWEAGLSARSRMAFKQVLRLDPQNREATAALQALGDPGKPR
jgi:predicted Zn-dependent protease